jgi:hypothetical protein
MNVEEMKAAVFPDGERPGRIAFTITRYNMFRLAWNCFVGAIRGDTALAIATGDLTVIEKPSPAGGPDNG